MLRFARSPLLLPIVAGLIVCLLPWPPGLTALSTAFGAVFLSTTPALVSLPMVLWLLH